MRSARTNTTANVKNTVVGLDVHLESKVVFMTSNSPVELLTRVVAGEMERSTPAVLYKQVDDEPYVHP